MESLVNSYSEALLDIAIKNNLVNEFKSATKDLNEIYKNSFDFSMIMTHPNVSKKDKLNVVDNLKQQLLITKFLKVLVVNNSFNYLGKICEEFYRKANNHLGIETVIITSAIKLEKQEIDSIKNMLENKLNKKVEEKCIVDKSLIAGIKVLVNGEILDNSISSRLSSIKDSIKKVSL